MLLAADRNFKSSARKYSREMSATGRAMGQCYTALQQLVRTDTLVPDHVLQHVEAVIRHLAEKNTGQHRVDRIEQLATYINSWH